MTPSGKVKAGPTVYVVDDDATLRRALERLLRSAGYVVETFSSAEDFLERSPDGADGALVLDVRMGGMSGPELQARLAAAGSPLRTFVISAVDDPRVQAQVLASGACGWFPKPVDAEQLLAALLAAGCGPEPA